MNKKFKRIFLILMAMILLFSNTVMAEGFNLAFYQALEGQEINMVDVEGNIIETVTIDAMGRATFKNNLNEGNSLEMDLSEPMDLETMNRGKTGGISLFALLGVILLTTMITFVVAAFYFKHKIEKKYEFLLEYEYNAYLDDE